MEKPLNYRSFQGTVEFSKEDNLYHGKLKNIHGTVLYEAQSLNKLTASFEEAVDEYIDLCKSPALNRDRR
jgi:predicted HicB family RNase H-like nuclease